MSARRPVRENDPVAEFPGYEAVFEQARQWVSEHARATKALPAVLAAAGNTRWRVYCWDADQWQPAGTACDTPEGAEDKLAGLIRRHPRFIGRVVRETTTYSIEGEQR